jgi:ATP-dependent DNA helicase RecG
MRNAEGGTIVVGLHDGEVDGTDRYGDRVTALQKAAINFTAPVVPHDLDFVPCVNSAGAPDRLLVITIEPGEAVHANHRDEAFLRVGDENRRLTFDQRRELLFDKGQSTYELQRLADTSFDDLSDGLLMEYATAQGHPDPHRLLVARGLAVGERLTVAGMLLFGSEPQRLLPEAFIRVLRYRGRFRGSGADQQLVHDTRCEGPIPHQLRVARRAIDEVQPTRRALRDTGKFGEVPLIPEDAWLEGVVNAAIHRSYSMSGDHIRVDVFDDRIEIHSPGRFPGLVRIADPLRTVRFARNPRIARVAADLDLGQELGEGIRRMFQEMRDAGLTDPLYEQTSGSVRLVLSAELADRTLDARLPDDFRRVVSALRDAGRLGSGEVAGLLGVSRPTAVKRLAAMQAAGVIEWVGNAPNDPRAYWRLSAT